MQMVGSLWREYRLSGILTPIIRVLKIERSKLDPNDIFVYSETVETKFPRRDRLARFQNPQKQGNYLPCPTPIHSPR